MGADKYTAKTHKKNDGQDHHACSRIETLKEDRRSGGVDDVFERPRKA